MTWDVDGYDVQRMIEEEAVRLRREISELRSLVDSALTDLRRDVNYIADDVLALQKAQPS